MATDTTSTSPACASDSNANAPASATAPREHFASRLGFILISAGCAIGLGNVWRFPYIAGEYGGAAFIVLYLIFLVILGLPVMVMEFAVGRASQRSAAQAFDILQPSRRWHWFSWWAYIGCMLLMMFYTTVAGWMLSYIPKMATANLATMDAASTNTLFSTMLASPSELVFWMFLACAIALFVCHLGLQKGVERVTKVLMVCLLALIAVLVVRSVTLEGAGAGIAFYLNPDFSKIFASPGAFSDAVFAALGQAFFTLSIGLGSMEIFGSYINKKHALPGEAVRIAGLDTFVALATGFIIFPACFAFGVAPDSGPGLVFVTLPAVFSQMWMGGLFATLFFVFMSFAAISTLIAVFEAIMSFWMDQWKFSRNKAVAINAILIPLLSLPCALGFNVWSGAELPGIGNIQAIEDFVVSNNLLIVGSLVFTLFCVSKRGWGWKSFLQEVNTGDGMHFPKTLYYWVKFGIPALIIVVLVSGWAPLISSWLSG